MDRLNKLNFEKNGINIYYYKDEKYVSRKAVVHIDTLKRLINEVPEDHTYKLVLECSTKGDVRFSAFGARLKVFGVTDCIEFHYQLSKGFEGKSKPKITDRWDIKKDYIGTVKGKSWDYFELGNKKYESGLIFQWYHLLWLRYLDENFKLVDYLRLFDDYNDIFKGKSLACQADSIRKYIKDGREKLLAECEELNSKFKNPMR